MWRKIWEFISLKAEIEQYVYHKMLVRLYKAK